MTAGIKVMGNPELPTGLKPGDAEKAIGKASIKLVTKFGGNRDVVRPVSSWDTGVALRAPDTEHKGRPVEQKGYSQVMDLEATRANIAAGNPSAVVRWDKSRGAPVESTTYVSSPVAQQSETVPQSPFAPSPEQLAAGQPVAAPEPLLPPRPR